MRTHLDLFSGIGGFALACRWAGVKTIGFSEIDPYASRVLQKNFAGVVNYGDIRNVPKEQSAWLITGGFPCQPFSVAGKRQGKGDDRWLWPEMVDVINRVKPDWVLAENVPGIINMELDQCLVDLEGIGYAAQAVIVPACAVDAPHRRSRIWIVANANSIYSEWRADQQIWEQKAGITAYGTCENVAVADDAGCAQQRRTIAEQPQHASAECGSRWKPEPELGRVAHGIPHRVDRLRGLGNAIVPQVAYELIRMMISVEKSDKEKK